MAQTHNRHTPECTLTHAHHTHCLDTVRLGHPHIRPHTGILGQTQTPAVTQSTHTHARAQRYQIYSEHRTHTHAEAHVYVDTTSEGSKPPGTCRIDVDAFKAPGHLGSGHTQADILCTRVHTHTQPQSVCRPST